MGDYRNHAIGCTDVYEHVGSCRTDHAEPRLDKVSTEATDFEALEKAALAAFRPSKARVLDAVWLEYPTKGNPEGDFRGAMLVVINTKRKYGTFAVLEFNCATANLHTGHYFDSMDVARVDFYNRQKIVAERNERWPK